MLAKVGAAALTVVACVFIVAMGLFAWGFLTSGEPIGIGMGVGVAVLTPIILWTILREVRFGFATQRLGAAEAREDFLAGTDLSDFPSAKKAVEAEPENWQAWYALAFAYESNRDRRGARRAMREAVRLNAKADTAPDQGSETLRAHG